MSQPVDATQTSDNKDFSVTSDFVMNLHLIRRIGIPDDIAYLALYLASDESSWVTGQNFSIDGGVTAGYR
jgi:NAD(P)-dependent dehydrogenase (short-subunit alcohol dehydrogenase family)